jgi:hypothetical protein
MLKKHGIPLSSGPTAASASALQHKRVAHVSLTRRAPPVPCAFPPKAFAIFCGHFASSKGHFIQSNSRHAVQRVRFTCAAIPPQPEELARGIEQRARGQLQQQQKASRWNITRAQPPFTGIHVLHRRLVVRVQRQRPARHAVHAPAVLDGHKVRVVPRHERHRAGWDRAVELGEAPYSSSTAKYDSSPKKPPSVVLKARGPSRAAHSLHVLRRRAVPG